MRLPPNRFASTYWWRLARFKTIDCKIARTACQRTGEQRTVCTAIVRIVDHCPDGQLFRPFFSFPERRRTGSAAGFGWLCVPRRPILLPYNSVKSGRLRRCIRRKYTAPRRGPICPEGTGPDLRELHVAAAKTPPTGRLRSNESEPPEIGGLSGRCAPKPTEIVWPVSEKLQH